MLTLSSLPFYQDIVDLFVTLSDHRNIQARYLIYFARSGTL